MGIAVGAASRRAAGLAGALGAALGLAVLLVGVLNGIGPFLRRVGLADRARYEAFWQVHTGPSGFTTAPFGLGRRCVVHRPVEEGGAAIEGGGPAALFVLEVAPWERPLKVLKDLLALAVAAAAGAAALRGAIAVTAPSRALVAFAVLVAAHAVTGLARGEAAMTVAGLRGFEFLAVALAAGTLADGLLRRLVPWLVALLVLQVALAPLELLRGIPVQGHMGLFGALFARRAAGTFVMPNTLGVFAAAATGLAATLGATSRVRALAWGAGCLAVALAGSATGLLGLGAAGAIALWQGRSRRAPLAPAAGLAVLLAASGIALVWQRSDVADSLASRGNALAAVFARPAAQIALGSGLGAGTSASQQLGPILGDLAPAPAATGGESALAALLGQTGLVGLGLAGVVLSLAWARRPELRPFLAAIALSSLTLGVTEAFPLGLLCGLALAGGSRRP